MTIDTRDQLIRALGNNSTRVLFDKTGITNQVAGRMTSCWRMLGLPGQPAIPAGPALVTAPLLGAPTIPNQIAPSASYLSWASVQSTAAGMNVEALDRLAHNGGLVLNVITAQTTTNHDLVTLAVPADRLGPADFSGVEWFLEVYADGGATASNATINVTYDNASTENLLPLAVGGTIRAGHLFPLRALIPAASQARHIRGINSVTLSASTGAAGNFGFTAVRGLHRFPGLPVNDARIFDWAQLNLRPVPNGAVLMLASTSMGVASGSPRVELAIAHG